MIPNTPSKACARSRSRYVGDPPSRPILPPALHPGADAGESAQLDAIGLDLWADAAGIGERFSTLTGFEAAFSGEVQTSVWERAPGAPGPSGRRLRLLRGHLREPGVVGLTVDGACTRRRCSSRDSNHRP